VDEWSADPFFQYPRTTFDTSEGKVELPILYFDDSQLMALFLVDREKAQAMVQGEGLEAVRFAGGKALVGVAFYEYRETSIGDYNEVGVAIAVVPAGTPAPAIPLLSMLGSLDKRRVGFFIVDLPVTTRAACAAGCELWGYPKFVTPIPFSLKGNVFRGAVVDPDGGGNIVELSGKAGAGIAGPILNLVLYSRHGGSSLRTLVNTRGGGRICLPGTMRLKVSRVGHPMAGRLTALGLEDAAPAIVMRSDRLQLRLNAGAVLP
jgi:hypothetical protein